MGFIFKEDEPLGSSLSFKIEKHLFSGQSQYQKLDIFETKKFGKIMVLDGFLMLTEKDEFAYHEMIAHVPLYSHPNPENVLVIGGGDGGTLREVVKHGKVKQADICEIDGMVIEKSKEFFPELAGSFSNPKVNVFLQDAVEFVKNKKKAYDVILIDSTDPIGPGEGLFNQEFYNNAFQSLKEGGILTAQAESPFFTPELVQDIVDKNKKNFPIVKLYTAFTPTYPSGNWSFAIGSKKYDPAQEIDFEAIKTDNLVLKYYNLEHHKASFVLPNFIKKIVE